MHMNADRDTFMHVEAKSTIVLPLHRYMDWKDTTVRHMRLSSGGKLYAISGKERVYRIVFDRFGGKPERMEVLYEGGGPLSCADLPGGRVAVLTTDGKVVMFGLEAGSAEMMDIPAGIDAVKLHCALDGNRLLVGGGDGAVFMADCADEGVRMLDNLRLSAADSAIVRLDERHLLLSGRSDELVKYDMALMHGEPLDVAAPSVKGRAFRAQLAGGAVLADGTIAAGTVDGMMFALSPDLRQTTAYGRLYSAGELRHFIRLSDDAVLGVYGGAKDAGHLFHFSRRSGFADLGRPRVIKDNDGQLDLDSEWANIHYISCIAYSPEEDCFCVASGEEYGCVIRYEGAAFPR
jgi:outer membrane protein assembly factor BamB